MTEWCRVGNRGRLVDLTFATYGRTCWICGRPGATTVDHVVPRSLGGTDTLGNLRPAHSRCNTVRGNAPAPAPITSRTW